MSLIFIDRVDLLPTVSSYQQRKLILKKKKKPTGWM